MLVIMRVVHIDVKRKLDTVCDVHGSQRLKKIRMYWLSLFNSSLFFSTLSMQKYYCTIWCVFLAGEICITQVVAKLLSEVQRSITSHKPEFNQTTVRPSLLAYLAKESLTLF